MAASISIQPADSVLVFNASYIAFKAAASCIRINSVLQELHTYEYTNSTSNNVFLQELFLFLQRINISIWFRLHFSVLICVNPAFLTFILQIYSLQTFDLFVPCIKQDPARLRTEQAASDLIFCYTCLTSFLQDSSPGLWSVCVRS